MMVVPPPWLARCVMRLADVMARVRRRLLPPHIAAIELGTMSWVSQSLSAFCELGLPQALADGPKTATELAAQGFGEAEKLFRLMRALAAYDVVRYAGHDHFALGYAGKALIGAQSASPFVIYANASWHILGYTKLTESIRVQKPGFDLAHGTPLFAFFETSPEAGAVFDAAMQSLTPLFARAFARAYDFSRFSHVVDVGGGTGALLASVLERFPHLRGTVFELAPVASRARAFAREHGLSDRLQAADGNIFTDAPPHADAYVFSHVLHDWDDESCLRMLQNVRRAMPAHAHVLVYEVLAQPPNNAWSQDRIQDLEMLTMLPGRERTQPEYEALFARSGLRLSRVVATGAADSIIEAVPLSS